jgi:hypothetical protein
MELFLESEPSVVDRTFGALYADGVFLAHTLEDVVRELDGIPVDEWKVQDKTAIPHGRYRVIITRSGRFSRKAGHDVYLPELLSVPGFDKIRIHGGNGPEDTDGCILVGDQRVANKEIFNCPPAIARVKEKIQSAIFDNHEIWLTVERKKAA